MPGSFTATLQGWYNTSSFLTLQKALQYCNIQQTSLLPHLNWIYLKWRWCRTWFQQQGWSGSQLELKISVAVSKINGVEITPCLINWMGTSQRPSELSPAFSLHLHKTSDNFAAENKDLLKATILLCLVNERNLRLGRCGYSRVYPRSFSNRCFFFLVSCSVP